MDKASLDALESVIGCLLEAFARVKSDKQQLATQLAQLQQVIHRQQSALELWEAERQELLHLRLTARSWQREREAMRTKLEEMLRTVERLEGLVRSESETPS